MSDYLNPPLPPPEKTTPAEAGVYALLAVLADAGKCKERLDQLRAERVATEHARRESSDYRDAAETQLDEAHEALQTIEYKLEEQDKRQAKLDALEKGMLAREKEINDIALRHSADLDKREAAVSEREAVLKRREAALEASYKKHAADQEQFKADRASLDRKLAKAREFIQA